MSHDVWTAKCVLVRADEVQSSLIARYTGPLRVLRRWKKWFRLQLENREDIALSTDDDRLI